MTSLDQLAGPGGTDPASIRWLIAARITLTSETHHGSPHDPLHIELDVDQPLDRDHRGRPWLPFTTLRGLLAHHLTARLAGYDTDPATCPQIQQLFGSTRHGSALSGDPMPWNPPPGDGPTTILRSHNRVDPATGTTADKALWTVEVLPIGSHGTALLTLATTPDDEPALLSLLHTALSGLTDPLAPVRIGARTIAGAGQLTVTGWAAHRYDLSTPDGYLAWTTPTRAEQHTTLHTAATHPDLATAIHTHSPTTLALPTVPDHRHLDAIDLQISVGTPTPDQPTTVLPGLLRVADQPPPDALDVDTAHRTVPIPQPDGTTTWTAVLGGEGLHAWLKTHATRIAHSITPTTATELISTLFGDPPTGTTPPRPGHLFLTDQPITDAQLLRRGRTPLDPVFGNTIAHRLFTELVLAGGTAHVQLIIRNPTDAQRGLLAHTLLDAHEWGLQPLGGGGHGHLTLLAATHTLDAASDTPTQVDLLAAHPPTPQPCDCPDPRHTWQAALTTTATQEHQ